MGITPVHRATKLRDQLATPRGRWALGTTAQSFQNLLIHPPPADFYGSDQPTKYAETSRRCLANNFSGKGEVPSPLESGPTVKVCLLTGKFMGSS
ncbi:MAG: hypothetical protein ACREB3_01090, partial [Burkholderiales bacterium]